MDIKLDIKYSINQTYTGHNNYVFSVVYFENHDLVVSVSRDKTAKIWDPSTGVCKKSIDLNDETERNSVNDILKWDDNVFILCCAKSISSFSVVNYTQEISFDRMSDRSSTNISDEDIFMTKINEFLNMLRINSDRFIVSERRTNSLYMYSYSQGRLLKCFDCKESSVSNLYAYMIPSRNFENLVLLNCKRGSNRYVSILDHTTGELQIIKDSDGTTCDVSSFSICSFVNKKREEIVAIGGRSRDKVYFFNINAFLESSPSSYKRNDVILGCSKPILNKRNESSFTITSLLALRDQYLVIGTGDGSIHITNIHEDLTQCQEIFQMRFHGSWINRFVVKNEDSFISSCGKIPVTLFSASEDEKVIEFTLSGLIFDDHQGEIDLKERIEFLVFGNLENIYFDQVDSFSIRLAFFSNDLKILKLFLCFF